MLPKLIPYMQIKTRLQAKSFASVSLTEPSRLPQSRTQAASKAANFPLYLVTPILKVTNGFVLRNISIFC